MQISEQTIWRLVYVILAIIGIGATIVIGWKSVITGDKIAEALNSAFRHTESSLETGFSQTEENAVILALGAKGDRPNWPNFLRKAKEEALDEGYVRISAEGFISTEEGERKLTAEIQTQIQETVKKNLNLPFEGIGARAIEELGIRRLSALAKAGRISLNQMIAIVAGFTQRIRTEE